MYPKRLITLTVLAVLAAAGGMALADPQGKGFTYQGQIKKDGAPCPGPVDLSFSLYDVPTDGVPLGEQSISGVALTNGQFTVELNANGEYGPNAFRGDARWLEIWVKPAGAPGDMTQLTPRQKLTAAPYALYSLAPWSTSGSSLYYTGGNVGIGTPSPAHRLDVSFTGQNGLLLSGDGTGDARIWFTNNFGSEHFLFDDAADLHHFKLQSGVGKDLAFLTNGRTERMRITADGNVGIGLNQPLDPLVVVDTRTSGTTGAAIVGRAQSGGEGQMPAGIRGENSNPATAWAGAGVIGAATHPGGAATGVWGQASGSDGVGVFGDALHTTGVNIGVRGRTLSSNGYAGFFEGRSYFSDKVGIGTSEPEAGLDLTVAKWMKLDQANVTGNSPDIYFGSEGTGEGIGSKRTAGGNQNGLDFYTGFASRMSITNAGRVGIGTNSPTSPLTVNGLIESSSGGVKFPDGSIQTTAAGAGGLTLPYAGIANVPVTAFSVTNDGCGRAGYFEISYPYVLPDPTHGITLNPALEGVTYASAAAVCGTTFGLSYAGSFVIDNPANGTPALYATTNGTGPAIQGNGLIESTSGGFKFPDGTIQTTAATGGTSAWSLTGNAGTTPGTNFLGTTDRQPLELKVENQSVLRIEPVAGTTGTIGSCATAGYFGGNWIAGYHLNGVSSCHVVGATIAGGGGFHQDIGPIVEAPNLVTGMFGTIGGGWGNQAYVFATVSGGQINSASGQSAFVGGGSFNTALGYGATVPGGVSNQAGGSYSLAAGRRAKVRDQDQVGGGDTDGDQGTFVWADSTDADFTSTGPNQFLIRASGGVGIGVNSPSARLHVGGTPGVDGIRFPDGTLQTSAAPKASANIGVDPPWLGAGDSGTRTITVTGAVVGDAVVVSPGNDLLPGYVIAWARVSTTNTVLIGFTNTTSAALDPAASSWAIRVIK